MPVTPATPPAITPEIPPEYLPPKHNPDRESGERRIEPAEPAPKK